VTDTILQFFVGGMLLCFVVWLKLRDVRKGVEVSAPTATRLRVWVKTFTEVAVSLFAIACILDPLIPGPAALTVNVPADPAEYPTLLENLRVCVSPFGFRGPAGGNRISCTAFDDDGFAEVVVNLAALETRVHITVFDETRPSELIYNVTEYVSPFVRRQLLVDTVCLSRKENEMNHKVTFTLVALFIFACLLIFKSSATSTTSEFQIKTPRANAVVQGEVNEVCGVGADPAGTVEVEVLTDHWYLQDGDARINREDGTWCFSPVHLAGKGTFNNHTLRATVIKDGRRVKSTAVSGIVRAR
jgi:hypothetical protein